jgi:O-antigen ligase
MFCGCGGFVRLIVESGSLGAFIFGLLFVGIFKHARKRYLLASKYEDRAVCYAVASAIITLLPISVGTMLLLSKSYGLYLWMLMGLSQRCGHVPQDDSFKGDQFRS